LKEDISSKRHTYIRQILKKGGVLTFMPVCKKQIITFKKEGQKIMKLKKILASILALCMVLSTISFTVFADDSNVAKIGDTEYPTLLAALEDASNEKEIEVTLIADAELDVSSWETKAIGGDTTEKITINGDDHKLTFNLCDSDWSHVTTKNNAKLVLNNMSITTGKYNSGHWKRNGVHFNCNVEMNDIVSDKLIGFKSDAVLNQVTVNELMNGYSVWLWANGQKVEINELTVNAPNGRGIKIADEDAGEEIVDLDIKNSSFTTAAKSAILVSSVAGANITTENVDISNVQADNNNIVWVDEDYADYQDQVIINGNTTYLEGAVAKINETYYFTLADAVANAEDSDVITIVSDGEYSVNGINFGTVTVKAAEGVEAVIDVPNKGNSLPHTDADANVTFENVTLDFMPNGNYNGLQYNTVTCNNCTINGQMFLYSYTSDTFNNCEFVQESANSYNVWTYSAKTVTFNECTFTCVGKSVLVYDEGTNATNINVSDCKFNASAPANGKAAIEISTYGGPAYVTVDSKTTAEGFGTGSVSGSSLWNNKDAIANPNRVSDSIIVVAGDVVYAKKANESAVAIVDGEIYTTMADAIAAIDNNSNVTILEGTYDTEFRIVKPNVTIKANGDVKFTKAPYFNAVNLYVEGIDFEYSTARDNFNGSGTIVDCTFNAETNAFRWCYPKGDITFDGCKIVAGTYAFHTDDGKGYTLAMNNCEISGFVALAGTHGSVDFKETKFYRDEASDYSHFNVWSDATFENCEFSPEFTVDTRSEDTTVKVDDCTVTDGSDVAKRFGDASKEKAELIIDGKYVSRFIKIGEKYYASISKAIAAASAGDVIVLEKDITENVVVEALAIVALAADEAVVIDLCGYTLNGSILIKEGATKAIVIKNGNIVNEDSSVNAVESNVDITLTDVNVKSARAAVRIENGYATINGGSYIVNGTAGMTTNVINVSGDSVVTIEDGIFVGPKGTAADSGAVVTSRDNAVVTINGGKFSGGKNNTLSGNAKENIVVNAGWFDQDPTAYVAQDTEVVNRGAYDYPYTVEKKAASKINVKLVKESDSVYNIVLSSDDYDIYEFVSAELTFKNESTTVGGGVMNYEISGITEDSKVITTAQRAAGEGKDNQFIISIPAGENKRLSGKEIKIGQVTFIGKGDVNFSVADGVVATTKTETNLGRYYKVADNTLVLGDEAKIENGVINEVKRTVVVNVAYNHELNGTHWDDNKITVTLKDGFGNTYGPYAIDEGIATINNVKLGRLTVTLEAPGFRKYVYETTLDEAATPLVLNFWNDVKRNDDEAIEKGKSKMAKNFVVGDIVMDYIVDEYDLAAVTSYYGTYDLTEDKYIQYDLNRDGNIDIIDVQYVLHTMNN
jgi:hypothetical protein